LVSAFWCVVYSGTCYMLRNHLRDFRFVVSSLARIARASCARCLHFVMPMCDSCICASMLGLMLGGTTILMPLYTTPSDTESSSRIVQYIPIACGASCKPTLQDHSMQLVQFICCACLELFVSCRCYSDEVNHIDHDMLSIMYCIWLRPQLAASTSCAILCQ